jgi:endonuclease/exonuclease/phosphatase family metal-dependent hydrolase
MPSFPKPNFEHKVSLAKEIKALREYRDKVPGMYVPASHQDNFVFATWNIANLGEQDRQKEHLKIIAELISWYDLVAIQETKENSEHLQTLVAFLGKHYKFIFSDKGGNNERLTFIYNSNKVILREEVAELAIPPSELKHVKLPGVEERFEGFDRSPYMVSFKVKNFDFTLLNVHLYFGDESEAASMNRRCLEAFCVGRWADLRSKSKHAFSPNVFALGDFNLPKIDPKNPVYKALSSRGLQLPEHSSKIYSNISNDRHYDQIAFLPGMKSNIISHGIFPYDNAAFAEIYQNRSAAQFKSYLRYYISDHRPMWMELNIKQSM